jgi:hypothetical protein
MLSTVTLSSYTNSLTVEGNKYISPGGKQHMVKLIHYFDANICFSLDVLTAITYFMLLEAGFGLCAICLPALSSTLKLPGVQTFFQNVSKIFSVHSNSSVTSSTRRQGSEDGIRQSGEKLSGSMENSRSNPNGISMTKNFSVRHHQL